MTILARSIMALHENIPKPITTVHGVPYKTCCNPLWVARCCNPMGWVQVFSIIMGCVR